MPVTITAVVRNDPLNAGVDWTLASCGNSDCGVLSAPHTSSGSPILYTPPANLNEDLAVTILAFATADRSKNLVAPLTITTANKPPPPATLKGTYVIQTTGVDVDSTTGVTDVTQFAGVVVLDGNGGVTSGEQTYTDIERSVSDPITGGSYFVGSDGRGTLTLTTADVKVGQAGIETFDIVVLSPSQVLIMKNDPVGAPTQSNQSATGTMDLQTSVNPLSQGYALVVTGTDIATTASLGGTSPIGIGGVLNVDSPNSISGKGSTADQDLPAVPSLKRRAQISGTVSNPDALGAIKFSLSAAFSPNPILFTGYIIDGTHIKLIETDVDGVNLTGAATAGIAVGQGAATGTFTNKNAFTGNYVFGIVGQDTSGSVNFTPAASSLTSAGTFTAQAGNLTAGFNEAFFGGLFIPLVDQFQAPCTLDKTGTGRLDCLLTYNVNGTGPDFILYQTGNGNPPLLLDADSDLLGGGGVGAGFAYPVSTPLSFNGDYGVTLAQFNAGTLTDFSGQFTANGAVQTLTGTLDVNESFVNPGPTTISGTFAPSSHQNVLSGTLADPNLFLFPNGSNVSINVDYYFIDAAHGFLIETDLADPVFNGTTVTFGYFVARTPLCQGCP